jgi:hypothetical protein
MSNSPYWIDDKKKLILIWSPKCACTSLHNGFIRNVCEITDKNDPRILAIKYKYIRMDYSKINSKHKNYFIYWGIRDPYDRIVSCYFNKFIKYNNRRLNENDLEGFSKNLLKQIGIDYNSLTFNKLLYGIQDLMSKNVKINYHFNTQININNYNKIKNHPNLFLFDINNIPEIFGNAKLNVTKYPNKHISIDLCNMKAIDIKNNMLSKKNFINSKELIKRIYEQDYKIFENHNIIY